MHKTIEEVEDISVDEFNEWVAYFRILDDQRNKNPNKRG
jgi:hypothetical protein